jgi:hypothetical protein
MEPHGAAPTASTTERMEIEYQRRVKAQLRRYKSATTIVIRRLNSAKRSMAAAVSQVVKSFEMRSLMHFRYMDFMKSLQHCERPPCM